MIKSFITSFKLKNAYKVNSFIYSLKGLPIINKLLPDTLYEDKTLKICGNIINVLREVASTFFWKFLYLIFMIFLIAGFFENNAGNAVINIFAFLTICGGLLNTYMFTSSKDEYYAIAIMNMEARKYTLSNYYYSLIKVIIGFMPLTIILGILTEIPLSICIMMPVYVVMIKTIANNHRIWKYKRTNKIDNGLLEWMIILICLILAYGLPVIGVPINENIFKIIFIICFIIGLYSFAKLNTFTGYKKMYKKVLASEKVYAVEQSKNSQNIKKNLESQIEFDEKFTSTKTGFAYFHDLFIKRHRKILTKTIKMQVAVITVIFAILILAGAIIPEATEGLNNIPLNFLPYFVFFMYALNRGTTLTQAMFMNCDHSMLTYRVYRTPRVILGMFKQRLKTLVFFNILPALIVAIGLPLLLWITGGTDNPLNYLILFVSIISMSIFFSVHNLVMYYLLQPYNANTEMKSATYKTVQSITYIICYYMLQIKLPTISFGIATIVFSFAYCIISLIFAYILAPKTFKLRV